MTPRPLILLLAVALISGCASKLPSGIAEPPPENPPPRAVAGNPERYVGEDVRWGGTIAGVENRADHTLVEVVARPLQSNGRPTDVDRSLGRFLARVPGFLDPAIYEQGRYFTVSGQVDGVTVRPIGDYAYRYPTVAAETHHLWEPLPERVPAEYDPFWYGPLWYDPWYRWHYRPYLVPRTR